MHARRVHRMHARDPRQHRGDHRPGQFVHEPAEEGVLLGRASDDRDRPDRPLPVPHPLDLHERKVVPPCVVAEMITERTLGLRLPRRHGALDDEVRIRIDRRAARASNHRDAMPGERAGERQFGQSLGKRHHRGNRHRRRAPDENRHPQRLAPGQRRGMVDADAPMELVVEAGLTVWKVVVARQLHAVHPEIRVPRAGARGILGVDRGEGDEGAAVTGPADDPGQSGQGRRAGEHRSGPHATRQRGQRVERRAEVAPGPLEGRCRIDLQLHEPAHPLERVGEDAFDPPARAVEVDQHGKRRAARPTKEQSRSARPEEPSLDLGDLEMRIDWMVDDDRLPFPLEGGHARRE